MAFSSLFWRWFMVVLLIVIPNSRIISSAVFETPNNAQQKSQPLEEDLVDKIVRQLSSKHKTDSIDPPSKKQDPPSNGINLEAKDPPSSDPTPDPPSKPDPSKGEDADTQKHAAPGVAQPHQQKKPDDDDSATILDSADTRFAVYMTTGVVAGFVGLMIAGVCYYKFRKNAKAASEVEYPAYGVTGPMKERVPSPGDRKLAQSAQMYHYQHQKQQMIAMEKANGDMKHDASDDDSEEDNVEGDYTVYECPGLAPTGEMEVKNPLFRGDEAPMSPGPDNNAPASHGEGEH